MAARDSKSSPSSRGDHEGLGVSLTAVSKTYRSGIGESVTAVDAVTLDIPPGQSLAITGRSGSGKSTLLHLIGAMDVPDEGQITIDGIDIARLRELGEGCAPAAHRVRLPTLPPASRPHRTG